MPALFFTCWRYPALCRYLFPLAQTSPTLRFLTDTYLFFTEPTTVYLLAHALFAFLGITYQRLFFVLNMLDVGRYFVTLRVRLCVCLCASCACVCVRVCLCVCKRYGGLSCLAVLWCGILWVATVSCPLISLPVVLCPRFRRTFCSPSATA